MFKIIFKISFLVLIFHSVEIESCYSQSSPQVQNKQVLPTKPKDGSNLQNGVTSNDCTITDLPSIFFKGGTIRLDKQVMLILNTISDKLKASPTCNIKLSGHGSADKDKQQLSWDQVNSAKNYLIENRGISSKRIIFEYGIAGELNTVDIIATTENGPNTQPPPHPDLRRL